MRDTEQRDKQEIIHLPESLIRLLLLTFVFFQSVSGLVIAFRVKLDFIEYSLLSIHLKAGIAFTFFLFFVYLPKFGRAIGEKRLGLGFALLCVFFAALPLTQYIFFQMVYPLAGIGMGLYLARKAPDLGYKFRAIGVRSALWLLAVPVLLAGWHLYLFGTLRHNFYHLLHRYGALAAAVFGVIFLLPTTNFTKRYKQIMSDAIAFVLAISIVAFSITQGLKNSNIFETKQNLSTELPIRVDLGDAASGNDMLPEEMLVSSESCSSVDCHKIIFDQWAVSPHRFAGKTEPYKKLLRMLAEEKGRDAVLLCSRCHTPLIAMAGLLDNPDDPTQDALRDEGISCQYCHIIDSVRHPPANGLVTVEFSRDYLGDYKDDDTTLKEFRNRFILNNLMPHRNIYRRDVHERSEYCAACHRLEMPITRPDGKQLILGDTHTSWTISRPAQEGVDCHACHLPLTLTKLPKDYYKGPPDHLHARPDHRFVGTCQSLSFLVPEEKELLKQYDSVTVQRLLGSIEIPTLEYFYLWFTRNPKLPAFLKYLKGQAPINLEISLPESALRGSALHFSVRSYNNTHAHVLPSGPLDLNELWLEVQVIDKNGRSLFSTPALDENDYLSPDALSLGIELYDSNGNSIQDHRFWAIAASANKRVLVPGKPRTDEFEIDLPVEAALPISVTAKWKYRRYCQRMTDFVYGPGNLTFPITVLAEEEVAIHKR